MGSPRIFVVTGANKGIGKSIVKLLLQDGQEKIVYLTSRNTELGKRAVKDLQTELNLNAEYHQLDITDQASINWLRDHLVEKHGGLDVLVNNAGMAYKGASTAPFFEQAEVTVNANFFGTLAVCDTLFPVLRENARVCHVSSSSGVSAFKNLSAERKAQFRDANLTMDGLKKLIEEFVEHAKAGTVKESGFPETAYGMSKLGVSIATILQQQSMTNNIIVNACCPGLVATDMTGNKYSNMLTPDEGADTPVFLALLPNDVDTLKGCFVKKREVHPYPPPDC